MFQVLTKSMLILDVVVEITFYNASNTSYPSSLALYAIQWFQLFPNEFFVWVQFKTCEKNKFSFSLTKQTKLDSHQNMMMHSNTKNFVPCEVQKK
jgi:hypothetical protein